MVTIYVTTREKGSGSTSVCAGIGRLVMNRGKKPGYLKPALPSTDSADATFIKDTLSLPESPDDLVPAVSGNKVASEIKKALGKVSQGKDVVIIDGPPELFQSSSEIAKELGASLLIVEPYSDNISQAIVGYKGFGQALLGVIFNKVPLNRIEKIKGEEAEQLEKVGVKFLGAIPEDKAAAALTVGELASCIDGEILRGEEKSGDLIENLLLGAMTPDSGPEYFGRKDNKAAVIRSERPDMQLAAISTSTRCLVLTGDTAPKPAVLIKAEEKNIPVITTKESSAEVMDNVEAAMAGVRLNRESRLSRFETLMRHNLDLDSLTKELGLG